MSDFQVRNSKIEEALRELANFIVGFLPKGWGFTLLIFDVNVESGSMFYTSNAERQSMIKAMEEFIEKNKE